MERPVGGQARVSSNSAHFVNLIRYCTRNDVIGNASARQCLSGRLSACPLTGTLGWLDSWSGVCMCVSEHAHYILEYTCANTVMYATAIPKQLIILYLQLIGLANHNIQIVT